MATVSNQPKVAYIYDEPTDTWHPVGNKVNAAGNYSWTGSHSFSGSVSFNQNLVAKSGVNNFQNPAARSAAIPSPTNGLVTFIRQDDAGNSVDAIQFYHNGSWRFPDDSLRLLGKSANYTLQLEDGGKSVNASSETILVITVPLNSSAAFPIGQRIDLIRSGVGSVHVVGASGVTVNSREGNSYLSNQYSAATLTKLGTDSWLLVGDLSSS
jgi:hypothetical protein